MLDIRDIKKDPERVRRAMKNRGKQVDIDGLLALDEKRREIIYKNDALKAEQNAVSKSIPALKKEGGDVSAVFARMKELSETVKENDRRLREIEAEMTRLLYDIPNIPDERVPVGKDSGDNVEIRRFSGPRAFDFDPLPHWEIGARLQILDPETAAKVSGARFHFYKGAGAKLERAVINFFLDTHTRNGYTEVFPPFIVNSASMLGTGQLPKFAEDMFKLQNGDFYLIPTAEVPVTNMHRDEILEASRLPIKYCAYSACFRAEAGSAGRDTRGLIRQHQFNKVELVKFAHPDHSYEELESLTADAERVLQMLGLPYRVVMLCTGDMGFGSAMTYDIEAWMPSYGRYVEISSCTNFEAFQSRRAGIRFRGDKNEKPRLVHTLNGSGVAVGRTVACILENYQNADGSVTVPDALRPYLGGLALIKAPG